MRGSEQNGHYPETMGGKTSLASTCSTRCSCDDELEDFAELINSITPSALLEVATAVRGGNSLAISLGASPICGSFNLVYVIHFEDGVKWAARIPQHAIATHFLSAQAEAMSAELELLRLIQAKTSVPVPEVFYYNTTFDNPLGAPFSLISWLEGHAVDTLWSNSDGPTPIKERRLRILESVAAAMTQLNFLVHPEIGVPKVYPSGLAITGTERLRARDADKEIYDYSQRECSENEIQNEPFAFFDHGPFQSTAGYLRSMLYNRKLPWEETNRDDRKDNLFGVKRLMEIMIDAIDSIEKNKNLQDDKLKKAGRFVLRHPDLDSQNVLISEEGALLGLLDWDGIRTAPQKFGFAAFPIWIVRDWEPSTYHYWADGEDSISELRALRKAYRGFVQIHSEEAYAATFNCHLWQVIELACMNKIFLCSVTDKLGRACLEGHLFDVIFEWDGETCTSGPNRQLNDERLEENLDDEESCYSDNTDDMDQEAEDNFSEDHKDEPNVVVIPFPKISESTNLSPLELLLLNLLIVMFWINVWLGLLFATGTVTVGDWLSRILLMQSSEYGLHRNIPLSPWASVRKFWEVLILPYNTIVNSDGYKSRQQELQVLQNNKMEGNRQNSTEPKEQEVSYRREARNALRKLDCGQHEGANFLGSQFHLTHRVNGTDGRGYTRKSEEDDKHKVEDDQNDGNDCEDNENEHSDDYEDEDDNEAKSDESYKRDPNQAQPHWLWELYMALGQGTVSEENIEKLKARFVEKFSTEEVVEEWSLS